MTTRRTVAVLGAALAFLGTGVPAVAGTGESAIDHVVIVGVPGLGWADVSQSGTPELWSAATDGSIGALSVRAARSVTCVLDGWATLGAGNRARFIGLPPEAPEAPEATDLGGCLSQEAGVDLAAVVAALGESPALGDDNSYGARPGALGAAVDCATGVGTGPVLALQREGARVDVLASLPPDAAGWTGVVARCPVTVVSMPDLIGAVDREAALAGLDERLSILRTGLPPATELILVGSSETGLNGSSLHVAIDVGPGAGPGYLTSASTGRTPYVQLIDVAPTALDRLGIAAPTGMTGQPWQPGQPRPESLAGAIEALIDADIAAREQGSLTSSIFWWLFVLMTALCLASLATLRHGSTGSLTAVRTTALVLATLPAATFLSNLVPWWRADTPAVPAVVLVVAMSAISLVALAGPWRARRFGPELVVVTVTAATLAADVVLLGSRLQLSSLLGYNPIVAGRFTGFGNIPFGIFAVSVLLVTVAVVRVAGPARERLVVALAGVTSVAVVGAPGLGSDFGGVLSLVPAYAVFALVLLRVRPSPARLGLAVLAGVVVVAGIAVADYLRPASERTHLGRFIGQLLDGSASTIVTRKAGSNLNILLHSPLTLLVPVFALTLWWLLRPGGELRHVLGSREVQAGLSAVAVAGLLGFVVNDSGIAVPVAAGFVLVPLALSAAADHRQATGPPGTGGSRVAAPDRRSEAVTVNSRDSAGPAD